MSQKKREYITGLLTTHGLPASGTIHIIREGDEANCKNEPLNTAFQPDSAVIHLIPKGSNNWLDGQCYDAQGYKVYAD